MDKKQTQIITGAVVVVLLGYFVWLQTKVPAISPANSLPGDQNQTQTSSTGSQSTVAVAGIFVRLEKNNLYFKVGATEKIAAISATTRIIRQTVTSQGKLDFTTIPSGSIKSGESIKVYFTGKETNSTYTAVTIQVSN